MLTRENLETILSPVTGLSVQTISSQASVEHLMDEPISILSDGDQYWALEDKSRKSLLQRIGIAESMVRRLTPATASLVSTELMQKQGESSALVKGGSILALEPRGRYKQVEPELVINSIESVLPAAEYNRAMIMKNYDVRIEVVGDAEHSVSPGDYVRSGVAVKFNPAGISDPLVQTFGLRLVCSNGMTAMTVVNEFSLSASNATADEVEQWLQLQVREAYDSLPETVHRWQSLREESISPQERPLLVEGLARQARLRRRDQTALQARAIEMPPENAYDVYNLMTWLTSHQIDSPEHIVLGQLAGAIFVDEEYHRRVCPTCDRAGTTYGVPAELVE